MCSISYDIYKDRIFGFVFLVTTGGKIAHSIAEKHPEVTNKRAAKHYGKDTISYKVPDRNMMPKHSKESKVKVMNYSPFMWHAV